MDQTTCPSVRTLNFSHEGTQDWQSPTKIANFPELSTSYYNTTATNTSHPNWFDYYAAPSSQFLQLATMSALSARPVTRDGASLESCGPGWNCSYIVNFTAPGYRCEELDSGVGAALSNFSGAKAPFDTRALLPEGDFSYFMLADRGDYASQQVDSGDGGIPPASPPFPHTLGAFRTEPLLWVGYVELADPNRTTLPASRADPQWQLAFAPHIFACEHSYTA